MSEQEIHDTEQEHSEQVDNQPVANQETVEESPVQAEASAKTKEELAAENWRKIRERNQELEKQNKEAMQRLAEIEAKSKKKELDPDDIPSWRDVNEALTEIKVKTDFPDFDRVVNQSTLSKLKEQDPDLAMMIYNNKDLYSQSAVAYRAIKKLGIFNEQSERDKATIQNNRSKPRTVTSMSPQEGPSGPLSHANAFAQGLTPDLQKQLLKEMNDARKKH